MVDLSELKAGDTVVFRGGRTDVAEFVEKLNGEVKRPYKIHYYNDGVPETYTKDGYFNSTDCESAMDIVEIIPQSKEESDKPKVDLSTLKVGDKVKFRNGSTSLEVSGFSIKDSASDFPYVIVFEDGCRLSYKKDGSYFNYKFDDNDIIEIIPQSKEESDKPKVDLHNIAEGDSVYCDDGSEHVVDNVTFDQNYAVITFYDFGTFEFNYDGSKFQEDAEIGNIVHVLHGAPEPTEKSDPVNHPSHYTSGGVECIEAIKASMTTEAYRGFLKGNVMKYLWRYEKKGKPVENLKKAKNLSGMADKGGKRCGR